MVPCTPRSRRSSTSAAGPANRARGGPRGRDMMIRWIFATLHLLGLGIGLGAVWARGRALRGGLDRAGLGRVFHADAWWGIAAVLWIGTGLGRAFGGLEKGSTYYLQNHLFLTKMALLVLILL